MAGVVGALHRNSVEPEAIEAIGDASLRPPQKRGRNAWSRLGSPIGHIVVSEGALVIREDGAKHHATVEARPLLEVCYVRVGRAAIERPIMPAFT